MSASLTFVCCPLKRMSENRESWLDRLKAKLAKRPPPPWSLAVDADGFSFVRGQERNAVRWADVKEVFAFKRDLFGYDLICIGFRVSNDGTWWEIDEKMSGYEAVSAAMEKAFPGIDPDWWRTVASPAFVANLTALWGEPKMTDL